MYRHHPHRTLQQSLETLSGKTGQPISGTARREIAKRNMRFDRMNRTRQPGQGWQHFFETHVIPAAIDSEPEPIEPEQAVRDFKRVGLVFAKLLQQLPTRTWHQFAAHAEAVATIHYDPTANTAVIEEDEHCTPLATGTVVQLTRTIEALLPTLRED